jgi:hypothetical protein
MILGWISSEYALQEEIALTGSRVHPLLDELQEKLDIGNLGNG